MKVCDTCIWHDGQSLCLCELRVRRLHLTYCLNVQLVTDRCLEMVVSYSTVLSAHHNLHRSHKGCCQTPAVVTDSQTNPQLKAGNTLHRQNRLLRSAAVLPAAQSCSLSRFCCRCGGQPHFLQDIKLTARYHCNVQSRRDLLLPCCSLTAAILACTYMQPKQHAAAVAGLLQPATMPLSHCCFCGRHLPTTS